MQFKLNKKFFEELEKILEDMEKNKVKKVLLQLPDGLKANAYEIVDFLEKRGFVVFIWGGTNWGACDLPLHFKIENFVDAILHVGHLPFKKTKFYIQKEPK
jgi:2-(3-amino-3-carboxypropyl)histidine synthase